MDNVSILTQSIDYRHADLDSQPPMTTTKECALFTHDFNTPRVHLSSHDAYHGSICSLPSPPSRSMTLPTPIEAQSTPIYDFLHNELVTPLPAVRIIQAGSAPVDASNCEIFNILEADQEALPATPTVKLPNTTPIHIATHAPTSTIEMQSADVLSRQTASRSSPLSPTAAPFVPRTIFQANVHNISTVSNLPTSEAKTSVDTVQSAPPNKDVSPSDPSRQSSPVPSLVSSEGTVLTLPPSTPNWPTFEESDHNSNHKPDDIEARLTALGLKFTVDPDCESEDDTEELLLHDLHEGHGGNQLGSLNTTDKTNIEEHVEITKDENEEQQSHPDNESSVHLPNNSTASANPTIRSFTVTKLGAWADMDEDDEEFAKYTATLDTTSTSGGSAHMEAPSITSADISPIGSPVVGSQSSFSPVSRAASIESTKYVFEPSAQNIFLSHGNRSLEFFEPQLSIEERIEKLCELGERTYEQRELASNLQEAQRLKKSEARARKSEVNDIYDLHFYETAWNDDEDGFRVSDLAVRQAELYIDACPYGKLPTSTAMGPYEYTYITAPQTVCADFAAMYIVKDDEGNDYYAVRIYDDYKPDLCGIYHHPFSREFKDMVADQYDQEGNLQAPIAQAVETDHDINRRFCLLRSLMFNVHPDIWHGNMIEERIAASKELGESNLRLMKAPIVHGKQIQEVKATGMSYRIGHRKRLGFRDLRTKLIAEKENGWQTYPQAIKEAIGCTPLRQVQTHSYAPLKQYEQLDLPPLLAGADDNSQASDNGLDSPEASESPSHVTRDPVDDLIFTPTPRRPRAFLGLGPFDPSPFRGLEANLSTTEENDAEGSAPTTAQPDGDNDIFDLEQVMNYPNMHALGFDLTDLDEDGIFDFDDLDTSRDTTDHGIATEVIEDLIAYLDEAKKNGNSLGHDDESESVLAASDIAALFMDVSPEKPIAEQLHPEPYFQLEETISDDAARPSTHDAKEGNLPTEISSIPGSWIDEDSFEGCTHIEDSTSALDEASSRASSMLYMMGIASVALALW